MSHNKQAIHEYERAKEHRTQESQIAEALSETRVPLLDANGKPLYTPIKGAYNGEGSDWHAIAPIVNQYGLHARPASMFIQTASKYNCNITVELEKKKNRINGKSILGLMTLEASKGATLLIGAKECNGGSDSRACVEELSNLVESGFGED